MIHLTNSSPNYRWFVDLVPPADEGTILDDLLSGRYDAPLAVIAVDLASGASRDVSSEIARKVELAAAIDQRTLSEGVQAFVEAQRSAAPIGAAP